MTLDAKQLALSDAVVKDLLALLDTRLGPSVALVLTNNRRRLLSYRQSRGRIEVRVSRRLLALGSETLVPIVDFVSGRPATRRRLQELIERVPQPPTRRRGPGPMRAKGETHDLDRILSRESVRAFGEPLSLPITWGPRRTRKRGQRSIRLGVYDFERGFIRIHPRLDHPAVPEWFVGFVVFHELLHHRFGIKTVAGRRVLHSEHFRQAEAGHPRYSDARRWEALNLAWLLHRTSRVRSA